MENSNYEFSINEKGIRRLGFEFGYGCTMGACRAMRIMGIWIGIVKTISKYAANKMKITVEKNKAETEEKTEE